MFILIVPLLLHFITHVLEVHSCLLKEMPAYTCGVSVQIEQCPLSISRDTPTGHYVITYVHI